MAFVAMWIAHAAPLERASGESHTPAAQEAIWCPLHRALKVTEAQWKEIEPRLRDFQAAVGELCRQTDAIRSEVIDLIAADETDLNAILARQGESSPRSWRINGWWSITCWPRRECSRPSNSGSFSMFRERPAARQVHQAMPGAVGRAGAAVGDSEERGRAGEPMTFQQWAEAAGLSNFKVIGHDPSAEITCCSGIWLIFSGNGE